ncbi:MAG: hypothetical protein IK085_05585 [Clostridia bacterium]|nr:hypothetical protein [Clostridia bacterium]
MTHSAERALKNAYAVLKYETPLGNTDCGTVCGAACCSGSENDCMFLLPFEDELVNQNGFTICNTDGNYGYPAVICDGTCIRNARPLACRFFPLFPAITGNDGAEKVTVIADPRASVCPLTLENVEISRSFRRAVHKAGLYLSRDDEIRAYLKKMTAELLEIAELKNKLIKEIM